MKQFTHGSLFAGIGGFDLGFERAGFKTAWQVEIDEYCRKVLARHFPEAERFEDVRECCGYDGWPHRMRCPIENHLKPVDVVTGGFPCQPHSVAGRQLGADDARWLWPEFRYAISSLRPRFVVLENVPGLFVTEFGRVLGGLVEIGYDAEWKVISAAEFGAPHRRERIFVVAYPKREGLPRRESHARIFGPEKTPYAEFSNGAFRVWSDVETGVRSLRECDGVSVQVVRNMVKPFGNAVMPQIAQWIAERIKSQLERERG